MEDSKNNSKQSNNLNPFFFTNYCKFVLKKIVVAPQFVTNIKGKKTGVFLSMKDYKKLIEEVEELEDIKAYDKAKKRNEKTIPLREAIKLLKKEKLSHA